MLGQNVKLDINIQNVRNCTLFLYKIMNITEKIQCKLCKGLQPVFCIKLSD